MRYTLKMLSIKYLDIKQFQYNTPYYIITLAINYIINILVHNQWQYYIMYLFKFLAVPSEYII